ncbi:MAG TPA: hypothetical protein VL598_16155 [Trinickia sp.]|uniref:hypothetical protein n=1 Tax=Trinickia sp. TaxID=2571163 RepID=UPI002C5CA11B|nr:hypothetical protein [Trinickia sp.]HTI19184.1 hypothetical protein [Trinickia sp.]
MIHFWQSMAADMRDRLRTAEWAADAGVAFALEKRRVDAQNALESAHGRMKTELINSLRQLTAQIKP